MLILRKILIQQNFKSTVFSYKFSRPIVSFKIYVRRADLRTLSPVRRTPLKFVCWKQNSDANRIRLRCIQRHKKITCNACREIASWNQTLQWFFFVHVHTYIPRNNAIAILSTHVETYLGIKNHGIILPFPWNIPTRFIVLLVLPFSPTESECVKITVHFFSFFPSIFFFSTSFKCCTY